MNMTKRDLRLLMLHEFKLGHNASEASANINRAWGKETTRDQTVRRWFGKFRSGDESRALKMKTVEDVWVVSKTSNCMRLLSKIHVKVLDKCVSIASLAPFEDYWKGEKVR
ncbi:hypothetical protein FHG87_018452 [Trinorchestia longiramus]|nr:hypothetical protein FHG87_018452 [Trinorchestia longiramus]